MKETPLVSVLMTSYNREKYIGTAIDSVLASTYPKFELIIVDDGSKDRTVEIAQGYAGRDGRVKVYRNEQNLGDYPNRNKAASYAAGKYLKYVDADDYIYPWGLELLVRMMEQFPEAGWGLCSLDQFKKMPFPFLLTPREAYQYNYLGPGLFHKAPLSSIIRRDVFEMVHGFSSQRMVGDYEMWHRLALQYNVLLMPQGIVWYREHDAQEINSYSDFEETYEKIRLQYLLSDECPLDKTESKEIISAQRSGRWRELIKALVRLKAGRAKTVRRILKLYNVR